MALVVIVVAVGCWAWPALHARPVTTTAPLQALAATAQYGGGAVGGEATGDAVTPAERLHATPRVSEKAALIWLKLNEEIEMSFPNETTLGDVLKYIQSKTDCEELPGGIPFYVDPAGLATAEKTMTSPVTIDLKGIPLATTLTLALHQLDLTYCVHKDGLIVIDSASDPSNPLIDPTPRILDELHALRQEVAELRREVAPQRRFGPPAGGMGGMGGGMGGGGAR